jgi:hypothetical protein
MRTELSQLLQGTNSRSSRQCKRPGPPSLHRGNIMRTALARCYQGTTSRSSRRCNRPGPPSLHREEGTL